MNALAIHLYLTTRYINLIFNNFGIFYRIIVILEIEVSERLHHLKGRLPHQYHMCFVESMAAAK
jgi:hypothetical protein